MAAIITDVTTNSTGSAVAFTDYTTLFPEGVFAGAIVTIESRVPTKVWNPIHTFRTPQDQPISITIEKAYELRAIVTNVAPTTNISINATE